MNREDIIRMAEEAGFNISEYTSGKFAGKTSIFDYANVDIFYGLKHFAALVAAAEREACAQIGEAFDKERPQSNYGRCIAVAIRARGNGGGK